MLFACLSAVLTAHATPVMAPSSDHVIGSLQSVGCFTANVKYTVVPPDAADDIVYDLSIMQSPATPGDTLAPAAYLIKWNLKSPETLAGSGFSAYFDGNHYRYRPGKLQEYHVADDPQPFAPGGDISRGVQAQAQFTGLLPGEIARMLRSLVAEPDCAVAVTTKGDCVNVTCRRARDGYEILSAGFVFDSRSMLPRSFEMTYNEGQPSEQLVTAVYSDIDTLSCVALSEQALIEMYPVEFEKYRRDTFSLQSLPGSRLPSCSAPTLQGSRWTHRSGESMEAPTVIAVLDYDVDSTPEVVADLRSAFERLPFSASLVLAFTGSNRDTVESIAGPVRPGEQVLVNARSVARNCGVADSPSLIFCSPDGSVSDIHIGRNNDLASIVIQKISIAR